VNSPRLDCDTDGRYDPFRTAQREPFEEATGPVLPDLSWITFIGLARTFKARFQFLFGELRLPITASQLLSQVRSQSWESRGLIGSLSNWTCGRCCFISTADAKPVGLTTGSKGDYAVVDQQTEYSPERTRSDKL
jgi:hypothetical protein